MLIFHTASTLYALVANTGQQIWAVPIPAKALSAPAVVQGDKVIVLHQQGTSAFNLTDGKLLWTAEDPSTRTASFIGDANEEAVVIVDYAVLVRDIETGQLLERFDTPFGRNDAVVALEGSTLYVVVREEIRQYDWKTDTLIYSVSVGEWSLQSWLYEQGIFYLERVDGGVSAFDTQSRQILWTRLGMSLSRNHLVKQDNLLLMGTRDSQPIAVNAETGKIIWRAEEVADDIYQTPLVMKDKVFIRGVFEQKIYAFDLNTGKLIGYLQFGRRQIISDKANRSLGPVSYKETIIFPVDNRVVVYAEP
jgi:outer membrane protein assembly factor BamB